MREVIIRGFLIKQPKRSVFQGVVSGNVLVSTVEHKTEYGRKIDKSHTAKIMQSMLQEKAMPTIPILALRNGRGKQTIVDKFGLHLEPNDKLNVIEGNHNITALRNVINTNKEFGDIEYPVSIELETTETSERLKFVEFNIKQRHLDKAHAFRERQKLLASIGEEGLRLKKLYDPLLKTSIIEVIEALSSTERSPLYNRILHPNKNQTDPLQKISERSMIRALRDYMLDSYNNGKSGEALARELISFYGIIRDLVPQAFKHPKDWFICRPGVLGVLADFCLAIKKLTHDEMSTSKLYDLLIQMPAFKKPKKYWSVEDKYVEYRGLANSYVGAQRIKLDLLQQFTKIYV